MKLYTWNEKNKIILKIVAFFLESLEGNANAKATSTYKYITVISNPIYMTPSRVDLMVMHFCVAHNNSVGHMRYSSIEGEIRRQHLKAAVTISLPACTGLCHVAVTLRAHTLHHLKLNSIDTWTYDAGIENLNLNQSHHVWLTCNNR